MYKSVVPECGWNNGNIQQQCLCYFPCLENQASLAHEIFEYIPCGIFQILKRRLSKHICTPKYYCKHSWRSLNTKCCTSDFLISSAVFLFSTFVLNITHIENFQILSNVEKQGEHI